MGGQNNYAGILFRPVKFPVATKQEFLNEQGNAVKNFSKNTIFQLLEKSLLNIENYHALLLMLFHQTYNSASSFALAAANCDVRYFKVRDYLIKHAYEEREHWAWIISDLESTGYKGPDPRELFPQVESQIYVSYGYFLAEKFPMGRLGMAMVLEGIGGAYGGKYGRLLSQHLQLMPNQAQFFLKHGELDAGHTLEILKVLEDENIGAFDWAQLCHVAKVTGQIYKMMYDRVGK